MVLLPLSLSSTRVKRLTTQVAAAVAEAAAVAAVNDEDGVQWQRGGGGVQWRWQRLMEATQQRAGAQREDERAAQQEDKRVSQRGATQQPAGARWREGDTVRGPREDETVAQREVMQQPDSMIGRQESDAARGQQEDESAARQEDETAA